MTPTLICNFDHWHADTYLNQMKTAGFPDRSIAEVPIEAFYEKKNVDPLNQLSEHYLLAIYFSAWHTPKEFIPGQYGGLTWDRMEMALTYGRWTDIIAWRNDHTGLTKYWQEPVIVDQWVPALQGMTDYIYRHWPISYIMFDHLIRRETHQELHDFQVECVNRWAETGLTSPCYVNGQTSKITEANLSNMVGVMVEGMGIHWSDSDEIHEVVEIIGDEGPRNAIYDVYRRPGWMWLARALANLSHQRVMPGRMERGGFFVEGRQQNPDRQPTTLHAEWPEYFGGD